MKLYNQKGEEIEVDEAQKKTMLATGHYFEEPQEKGKHKKKDSDDSRTDEEIAEEEKAKLISDIHGFTRKELDAYIAENNLQVPEKFTNMPDQKDWIIVNLEK